MPGSTSHGKCPELLHLMAGGHTYPLPDPVDYSKYRAGSGASGGTGVIQFEENVAPVARTKKSTEGAATHVLIL